MISVPISLWSRARPFIGFIGVSAPPNTAYVYTSQSPTLVTASLEEALPDTRQGVAIGFAATQVELYKNVSGRRFPADQFNLEITGGPAALVTTSGASNGLQSVFATVAAIPGVAYTLDEAMAAGSVSALTDYTQTVTAVNLTPDGTNPIIGPLPDIITPALGDVIQYTVVNDPHPVVAKTVTPAFATPGSTLTYTVTVANLSTTTALTNVLLTDPTPVGTTYANNLIVSVPFTGADPATGITLTSIPAGTTATVSWNVTVNPGAPAANPISNVATVAGEGFFYTTIPASTQINYADLISPGNFTKSASPVGVTPGGTITYTLTLNNTGTVPANNVVLTDPLPAGTTFVPGSLTGASGAPPTLTLQSPIPAGGSAVVTFQVTAGAGAESPILNSAAVNYTYTVDPAVPNGASGSGMSNTTSTPLIIATLGITKSADKSIAYPGDVITYNLAVTNTGNAPVSNVVITDPIPAGTQLVAGSLTVSVPFTGTPSVGIALINPIVPGSTVSISFQIQIIAMPIPNPIVNKAAAAFTYTIDPENPDGESGTGVSNGVTTTVFQNNYGQQISDLIGSVALGEAALAAIANAEGAKIQRFASMPGVTPQKLLCLNKSVADITDSIAMLESAFKQKLGTVECQINGGCNR